MSRRRYRPRPGRPRQGDTRKRSYTVSLEDQVAQRLKSLGRNNLSAGIAIAEFQSRGMPADGMPRRLPGPPVEPPWMLFELVDGPADPPRTGEVLDPFRESVPLA